MTIQLIKLVSGEEIIAEVETTIGESLAVSKARSIAVVQTGPQQYGLQLYPFLKGAPDETFNLPPHAIICVLPAPNDLERSYMSHTSGLELATSLSPLLG